MRCGDLDDRAQIRSVRGPCSLPFLVGPEDSASRANLPHLTMNKKSKTIYVVQPGCFGSGAILFSTYEFDENSRLEEDLPPATEVTPQGACQMNEIRRLTRSVVRLPEVLRRQVWQPLTRRVLNLGNAA